METKIQNYGIKIFHTLNESQKRWCAAQKATEIGHSVKIDLGSQQVVSASFVTHSMD